MVSGMALVFSGCVGTVMTTVAAVDLFGIFSAPKHVPGHMLNLAFTAEGVYGNLGVEGIVIIPLPWTNHYLIEFRFIPSHGIKCSLF